MAAVRGVDDSLIAAALAVALATLEEIQRRDGLEDEMEEKQFRTGIRLPYPFIWGLVNILTPSNISRKNTKTLYIRSDGR